MKKLLLLSSILLFIVSFASASDFEVTHFSSPAAANGEYTEDGTFGGKPAYQHNTETYHIWYESSLPQWVISAEVNDPGFAWLCHKAGGDTPAGDYTMDTGLNDGTDVNVAAMGATEYTVTFSEQNSLDGVSVAVYTDSERTSEHADSPVTTAGGGTATIDVENGTYYYTASKTGYSNNLGDVTVSDTAIEEQFTMTARKRMLGNFIFFLGD